ncbi:unnamed protein product [Adineta steineri]|nr:unnamed protein product [Adineta steineri]
MIEFNLEKVGRPAYFAYEIDENLEGFKSETMAGSLYLALLYFKTAALNKDLLLKMNGYETCVEILKTCWQNCPYSDLEFNIILRIASKTEENGDLDKENFSYFLTYLFSRKAEDESVKTFLTMLYIVSIFPRNFKPLPEFLLIQTHKSNNPSYGFHSNAMKFIKSDITSTFINDAVKKAIEHCVWSIMSKEYLNADGQSKFGVKDMEHPEFKLKFQNDIETVLKQEQLFNTVAKLPITVYEDLLTKTKNKEFYEFIIDVSNRCDELVNSHSDKIGYIITSTTGISNFNMTLSWEDIEKQISKTYSYLESNENCVTDLEWKVKSVDIKEHYDILNNFFEIKSYYPENIHFPLDVQNLPNGSLVREVFSKGYGKTFVTDLHDSYGQQSSIVKIDKKYFFYTEKEPKKGIDLVQDLEYDYIKELSYMHDNLDEFKSDLLSDVENWIKDKNSQKYISENGREEIKKKWSEAEAACTKINHELIARNILSQPLTIGSLKEMLLKLEGNKTLKIKANTWLYELTAIERCTGSFILDNDDLFKSYLKYCCERSIISPTVLKLICQRNEIGIFVYEKLDTPAFELKSAENDYIDSSKCKKQYQFWLNKDMYCQMETKAIEDAEMIKALENQSTVVGYLQTPKQIINLKSEYDINDIADTLAKSYFKYEKTNVELFDEIRRNITLITNTSSSANLEMLADGKQIVRINCLESLMGVMLELIRNKFSGLLQKKIYVMPFSRGVEFSIKNLEKIKEMLTDCRNGKHILLVTPEQRLCFQLKKQETFLEYLQSKDANDLFDWQKHYRKAYPHKNNRNTSNSLTDSQLILKQTLQSLGYIDDKNKIVKVPSEDSREFGDGLRKKMNDTGYSGIVCAYHILRDQSTQIKIQRQQKLELLYLIDEFQFFDILDESDEILRHGKELNYTLGLAKPLDGGPIRWEIPFLLFKIIFSDKNFGETLKDASQKNDCPVVFQENFRPVSGIGGGSPLVRFVKHEHFVKAIRPEICRKVCEILRLKFHEKKTEIIDEKGENYGSYEDFVGGKFISEEDKIIELLKTKSRDMLNSFLLAKAWISHELLYHIMSYRYRVEYGLSEKEGKETAIPFRGKDLPSENSEFSHPDIMIGFTVLSYLYRGLDVKQVKDGLVKLKSDPKQDKTALLTQFVEENQLWINEQIQKEKEPFPQWLNSFTTLDLENENKTKKAHLYLSRNFTFIQYYLSNFTFPNETKHYEKKLTGNAHTLAGEGKTNGFSGTDDRNDTMPESIVSKRLASQTNTIMVVLRNDEYLPLAACHIDNKKLFVYLDEVHTRGTDLKLPLTAHGIVTLGKNMNKDKLMQAVMRLRDLDFNQSVVLWGTGEISAEVAIINGIRLHNIASKHVLTWVTYNTIRKNESDLYLVMKEKLKYVIKSRALEYQKKLEEIPMDSLIKAYEPVSYFLIVSL